MTTLPAHGLLVGGELDLSLPPKGPTLEAFVTVLSRSDDAIRTITSIGETLQRVFGDDARRLLGFTKGYVAGVSTIEEMFRIVGYINEECWDRDGDRYALEDYVGSKRQVQTEQGLLVKKLVSEKVSYITPDYSRDRNITRALRDKIKLKAVIVSPLVVSGAVVGYVLLGYPGYPAPEVQWMHEYLIRHTAVAVMQTFWVEKLKVEVEHNTRWSSLGQQAGALMHDLNTPIATLNTCLQMLSSRNLGADNVKLVKRAMAQVDRIKDTVANLLSFVRDLDLRYRNVQVRKLLEDARRTSRAGAETAKLTGDALDSTIYVDREKMLLVLRNVINNAFESSPPDGDSGPRTVEVRAAKDDHELVISVLDNGSGLPDPPQKIFEPFYSTKQHGHGLGLSVTERFVNAHGGRVRARNRPEGGACIDIVLPLI